MPTRLIDLHVDWLLQYVHDSTVFDPAHYPEIKARLSQTAGYLQTTRAAVLACSRSPEDWASRTDPWAALIALITRIEAEFAGRLLIGVDDFDRWEDDPNGMTWGVVGVAGFDATIRSAADLAHLKPLFERGVRLFQPVATASGVLGGSATAGDDRGLTPLGLEFLDALRAAVPKASGRGPLALLDLAHLNHQTSSEVLDWFEADTSRTSQLLPIYSHGTPVHDGYDDPRALPIEHLSRLRALGGYLGLTIAPPFFTAVEQVEIMVHQVAAIPFQGQPGMHGIAIGTDFPRVAQPLPQVANAEEVVAWVLSRFDKSTANALLHDNARRLVAQLTGASHLLNR